MDINLFLKAEALMSDIRDIEAIIKDYDDYVEKHGDDVEIVLHLEVRHNLPEPQIARRYILEFLHTLLQEKRKKFEEL